MANNQQNCKEEGKSRKKERKKGEKRTKWKDSVAVHLQMGTARGNKSGHVCLQVNKADLTPEAMITIGAGFRQESVRVQQDSGTI